MTTRQKNKSNSPNATMGRKFTLALLCMLGSLALGGCASTSHNPKDPFESFNRGVYKFNDAADKAVVKPVAKGYNTVVPEFGRTMLSNFFSNLNDVTVALNGLLQLKGRQAASDVGRVVVNTTVGLLGLVDVSTSVGLAKHNADFGQTLGHWGLGSGPYLMLPLLGPSSVRDGIGLYADTIASVMNKVKNVDTRNEAYVTNLIGKRAALLDQENVLNEAAIDRYAFIRDVYLQHRQSLVYDGNPPREDFDDEDDQSKPDNRSSNDNNDGKESNQSAAARVIPAGTSIEGKSAPADNAATADSKSATPVFHIWVSQGEGKQ